MLTSGEVWNGSDDAELATACVDVQLTKRLGEDGEMLHCRRGRMTDDRRRWSSTMDAKGEALCRSRYTGAAGRSESAGRIARPCMLLGECTDPRSTPATTRTGADDVGHHPRSFLDVGKRRVSARIFRDITRG
jgi:hypothetical protein